MINTYQMRSSKYFTNFIVISLFLVYKYVEATDNVLADEPYSPDRDALLALKEQLNSSFLDEKWVSIMCFLNDTSNWYGVRCLNGRVTDLALENLGFIGEIKADAFFNLTHLSTLSFKNNSLTGNMMNFSNNRKLTKVDLSSNKFVGPISRSLLHVRGLESLELQENNFNGSIPPFNQSTLREFNVSNNNLSSSIPNTVAIRALNDSSAYSGNKDVCGPPSNTPCSIKNDTSELPPAGTPNPKSDDSSDKKFGEILVVVNVVALVILILLFMLYFKKLRELKWKMSQNVAVQDNEAGPTVTEKKVAEGRDKGGVEGEEKGKLTFMQDVASFELSDLLKASAEGLGKGNFGNCYKAKLEDGRTVAVKRLRDLKPLSGDEFVKQLHVIADQKHPNLLPLLAYYYSKDERLLVHKFASHGNIFNRLHEGRGVVSAKGRIPFNWNSRLAVARGVARALEYLHLNTRSQVLVPHGNLKSSNVLLDENDMVLVSDYGLTSLISLPIASQRMVAYKSPEYLSAKKISKKSDVWSYGCFLLELLTGRVSSLSSTQSGNGVDLGSWVHRAIREEWTAEIFDLEIAVQRSAAAGMLRLLQLAVRCCDKLPDKRPNMGEVVREVENVDVAIESSDDDRSQERSLTDDSLSGTSSM